jgi:hypothetical protein
MNGFRKSIEGSARRASTYLSWLHCRFCKKLPLFFLTGGLLFTLHNTELITNCRSDEISVLSDGNDLDGSSALENELLKLINQQRGRQGLQALSLDSSLAKIAREHSRDMAQQGFISHDQPSGVLRVRMNRVGYRCLVARENVASAQTIGKAHTALMNSSPHKDNILAGDVTRIGIGIAKCPQACGRQLYVTEIFSEPEPEHQLDVVQNMLATRVDELRQKEGGSLQSNPVLEKIASRYLPSIGIPYKREELRSLAATAASELQESDRSAISRIEVDVQLIHNPKNLSVPVMNRQGNARIYGFAVREIADYQNRPAFLVLALVGIAR